ncbi:MAG: putative copper amine oxidase [Streblomastix strix]|uniref:Putative copper amine oxidase n=1 Tax=Streblomastix strix TaxID=222440 RepID=A0A5J4VL55_9EUKA|nr:MAG: putative copper amine oxidase [Streblomastix strix]
MDLICLTLAGSRKTGFTDGQGEGVRFSKPASSCLLPDGTILISDSRNNALRRLDLLGNSETFAAQETRDNLLEPTGLALSPTGDMLYIADSGHHRIRAFHILQKKLYTVAGAGRRGFKDGKGLAAEFNNPTSICVASDGSLFVGDEDNNSIRIIDTEGVVSTLIGGGTINRQRSNSSSSIKRVYFRDGDAKVAALNSPSGICLRDDGLLIVADRNNHCIRAYRDGIVQTIAGIPQVAGFQDGDTKVQLSKALEDDPTAYSVVVNAAALFNKPCAVAVAQDGSVLVVDMGNHAIRRISRDLRKVSTIAGALPMLVGTAERTLSQQHQYNISNQQQGYQSSGRIQQNYMNPTILAGEIAVRARGQSGFLNGLALGGARLYNPRWITLVGSAAIVIDQGNHAIRLLTFDPNALSNNKLQDQTNKYLGIDVYTHFTKTFISA